MGFIHAHSVVLGFWAYAGILGFFAIVSLYKELFKIFMEIIKNPNSDEYLPVIVIYSLEIAWDFFFSPITGLRTTLPFVVAILLTQNNKLRLRN